MIIAQITDLHVGTEVEIGPVRICAASRLALAIADLSRFQPPPDAVLVTGDLTKDGTLSEYEAVKAALAPLSVPIFLIPGNHDDRANLRTIFHDHSYLLQDDEFLHHVIDDFPVRLIGLDTHIPGEQGGRLCATRLEWLSRTLAAGPGRPTLIYMHHPPVATGIAAFDRISCDNAHALGEIVAGYEEIQAIVCGHVHRAINSRWCGTVVHVTPSTFVQYPLCLSETATTTEPVDEPPAYAIHHWSPGAGIVSHLRYVPIPNRA